jgi:two-component system heavy metal sensor histidine kinase CusS
MTEDMLCFLAKADDPQMRLDWQRFEAREELDKVADYFAVVAEDKSVRVEVDGHATLRADRRLVQRALNNLFANAVRHAPPGTPVTVRIGTSSDGSVQIAIANAGPEIAPEHLPRLFDRFYRTDPSRPDSAESRAGARDRPVDHADARGLASAASEPGGLTTFTLRFPPAASPDLAHQRLC